LLSNSRVGVYQVGELLGEGGMSGRGRRRSRSPHAVRTRVLAALNYPHIAAIYGFERSGGINALVIELVEGEDLAQRLARGPMPRDEVLPIARQIAEAIEAAHDQGIVHRDLKAANVKVRPDGTVEVLDFGLAKLNDSNPSNPSARRTTTSPRTENACSSSPREPPPQQHPTRPYH